MTAEKEEDVVPLPARISEAGEGVVDTERIFHRPGVLVRCLLLSKGPVQRKQARTQIGQEDDGG